MGWKKHGKTREIRYKSKTTLTVRLNSKDIHKIFKVSALLLIPCDKNVKCLLVIGL